MAPGILNDSHSTSYSSPQKCRFDSSRSKTVNQDDDELRNVSAIDMSVYTDEQQLVDDIVSGLKRSGGCIIRNMFAQSTLDTMEGDIRPYLDTTSEANAERDDFVPCSTRMVTGLLSKSRTYATEVVGNRIWHQVCERLLTSTISNYWHGQQSHTSTSLPQLSTTVTFSVGPGTPAQGLHRDDDIYHTYYPAAPTHHLGRDNMVCFFVAGKECTRRNGATRFVPGSHLWDFSQAPPLDDNEECSGSDESLPSPFAYAEMSPGDAFMMLGGVFHGAGANRTLDQERLVYAAFACRGFLRQEENQYLANDLARIADLPLDVLRFAGFAPSLPFMGWVNMETPVRSVLGRKEEENTGFW